jgi:hydrogenase-4 component E
MEHMGFGALSYDAAHLLGGLVLALSFALLSQRRIGAVINTYALQAAALAAAAAWQGFAQHAPHLFITAGITLAVKAVLIPLALHRIAAKLQMQRGVERALGIFPTMALGVGLVALSVLVVLPTTAQAHALAREDLALALSVVLLGLLMMISRQTAITQVIGFMSLENGLILAAVGVDGMPLVVELSVAVLVLVAFVVFGVFFFRIRAQFDSLDVSHLDDIATGHR